MKCIKMANKYGRIVRVDNETADKFVKAGGATYCPKHEFKAQEAADRNRED